MIQVVIKETGQQIDVKGGIKYTFQTSEIGDISQINSSWSWAIKFPKTPNNISIFDGLGLVGSTSDFPYQSIKVAVVYNSITIIENANLEIISYEGNEYKGSINSGISEFFNKVDKLKLQDISKIADSDLNHDKNLTTITDSWTGTKPYMYVMADYNGKLNSFSPIADFNSFYLVPSANVKWLMDKVFENYGWTYSGLPEINLDWMSYGNQLQEDGVTGVYFGKGLEFNDVFPVVYFKNYAFPDQSYSMFITPLKGEISPIYASRSGSGIIINQAGRYEVDMPFAELKNIPVGFTYKYKFKKNGSSYSVKNKGGNRYDLGNLNVNDVIFFEVSIRPPGPNYEVINGTISFTGSMTLISSDSVSVGVQGASLEYKIIEFFKEIMMRNASIAIANVKTKNIAFYDIETRLNFPVVDWTDKLIKKTSERYVYQDYAKENYLRHTYAEKDQDYNDGHFDIDNENLEASKTIYQSKTFSSNKNPSGLFPVADNDFIGFEAYKIEIKNDGEIYNPLNKRFFFMRAPAMVEEDFKINGTLQTSAPWAEARDFKTIKDEMYKSITDILNRVKVVNVELNLNLFDVKDLSFEKRYYFQQEAAYFLLNKLTWDSEQAVSKAEFIKVNQSN